MRLNRLDLIRYGRFNDARITLPLPNDGAPDVTLIYGPNESGKSTAFTGFLELLFGMQSRNHPYAFQFERNDLLVGAELDLPGRGPTVLRRNSKRAQSLLDEQGRVVQEAILSGALHGLGHDEYLERFSLNDEGLRSGGERIADAKGDLGQLLHAGVSGLTNMAQILEAMDSRADKFHKKGGRNTILNSGKSRLTEISRALRDERLTPERGRKLRKACDDTLKAYNAADAALDEARKRQAASKAAQIWWEQTDKIQQLEAALALLPDGPNLQHGTVEQVAALSTTISEKSDRILEADETIRHHEAIIAENKPDPLAPSLIAALAKLDRLMFDGALLTSRANTAEADLRNRTEERDQLSQLLSQTVADLGVSGVPISSLVLKPDELEALTNAAQACQASEAKVDSAVSALQSARAQLGDAPQEPRDLTHLTVAWNKWQGSVDPSQASHVLETEQSRLAKAVAGLPANWPSLVSNGLPTRETLQDISKEWNGLVTAIAAAARDLEERETIYTKAVAQRQADESAPASIDMAETEETRRQREAAWSKHRDALSDQTADLFETAMRMDDGARTNFLMGTEVRKQLETSRRQEAEAQALFDRAQAILNKLNETHAALEQRTATLANALGLPTDTGPSSFIERHSILVSAAEITADVAKAKRDLSHMTGIRQAALNELITAARAVGIITDETALPVEVNKVLTLQESIFQTWNKWKRDAKSVAGNEESVFNSRLERDKAFARLEVLTAPLPLADRTASGIIASLPHLRILERHYKDHQHLSGRIEAMERALEDLSKGAAEIAQTLGDVDLPHDDPAKIIDIARTRTLNADKADNIRRAEKDQLARETKSRTLAIIKRDEAQEKLERLFEGQEVSDLPAPERASFLAERDTMRADLAKADQYRNEVRARVIGALFDDELARLPDATRDAELQQELEDAQDARDRARDERVEKDHLYKEAFDASDNSTLVTEQATILEELRSGARQAAIARLGAIAARGALRRLAAERRSTMLKDVEEAFVTMTSNEWEKVDVWSEAKGEKLVGVRSGGAIVPVEKMSTGTMGQLYFALRLAGYRNFSRDPGPLPMILDDIMETFDDTRASAALHLCAEIGRSGQAIMFTHHQHLVSLAKETIPTVSVVEMPKRAKI